MRTDWTRLNEAERGAFTVLTAFLSGRLASMETIGWALHIRSDESVKQAAILQLIDSPDGRKLADPWRAAWRLIEEQWDTPAPGHLSDIRPYDIGERVKSGDRSGSLVTAIADCVAPRLRVSLLSDWRAAGRGPLKKPRTVADILSTGLTSTKVVDPHTMRLQDIEDDAFLAAAANALEGSLVHGLDIARRIGWDGERKLYRLGQLNRAYFVPEGERNEGEHEPDEFHEGIAPCVKILHFVVDRLAKRQAPAAREIAARWKLTPSPFHLRLWAALARNPWVASGKEVSDVLVALNDKQFWDVQNYPEVAELRAVRFMDFDSDAKSALGKRLRKLPPRNQWSRRTDAARLPRMRLYWSLRELRRIEIAGGVLDATDKTWHASKIGDFAEIAAMDRLDVGFMSTPEARSVPSYPDARFDSLSGIERLSAIEAALGTARHSWDDDAAGRAWDWMREPGNAAKLIPDLEASASSGAAYPMLWERFGWAHMPASEQKGPEQKSAIAAEAARVLRLLGNLPEATIRTAIDGITNWFSNWRFHTKGLGDSFPVWQRVWPLAVEATNAAQPAEASIDLNLVARPSGDREPMDLDTLNTPAGKLVDVFLAACPTIKGKGNPFTAEGIPRSMRETVIATPGRSGLIVRHRLIEALPYFLRADPAWAQEKLVGPLLDDSADALSLWRALARRTQFIDVLKYIGEAMAVRATDLRLGRETRQSLVFSLVVESLHALNENRTPAVPYAAIQQMIRALDDEVRAHAAGTVQQFVRDMSAPKSAKTPASAPEDLFHRAAAPFLRDVWPQERSLSTPGVSKALADLPATARNAFVPAVDAIRRFLMPFDTWSMLEYGLFGDDEGEPKLSNINTLEKATAFLELLDATIGTAQGAVVPYDLGSALAQIETVAPELPPTPPFRRLATAARR